VHDHAQQQARAVDRDVALAPLHLLGGVVAARPPFSVVRTLWASTIAADIQDADGVGDLLRRLKRLYCWLRAVFADGAYDRLAVLLACFALGRPGACVRALQASGTESPFAKSGCG
jgi:hypothetical protein